ncbi:autophagy-related protein 11-like [Rutidosis leptorrhynchoides]|uniref:autophagy-related protein 11-like n=1 Tax=Rutidosis leptorrhynchoides TaxID=125765 RepID=UPI003A9A186C
MSDSSGIVNPSSHLDSSLVELQNIIEEKSNQLTEVDVKLEAALKEVAKLDPQMEMNRKLLKESQINCAHLENCLNEARAEARTHLCAAN